MIIYVTKETAERYNLTMPDNKFFSVSGLTKAVIKMEEGDALLEWGAKLFYFDRRKCLEVANFSSKLTLFLIDIKVGDLQNVGGLMAQYMFDIFENDREMTELLARFFKEHPIAVFSKLKDRSSIAHLNHTLWHFADDGYRLYEYIENGILQTRKFNKFFNTRMPVTKMTGGKKEYVFPAEEFKKQLKERYRGK